MAIKIAYLEDYKEYMTALAHWSYRIHSHDDQPTTIKAQIDLFKKYCNKNKLPLTLIALDPHERLIGMCSLKETEKIRPELTPWLSLLYIIPAYDNRQARRLLTEAIKEKAKQLGYKALYLLTSDSSLEEEYIHQGWSLKHEDQINKHLGSILESAL
jgi:Acetyltransferase (GNAT) family